MRGSGTNDLSGKISIDIYPEYLPKIYFGDEYSIPFTVRVSMYGFENRTYDIKACIVSNLSRNSAATQIWNGSRWLYSGWYALHDVFFHNGRWSGWITMRFKRSYADYRRLANQSRAYIILRVRGENNKLVTTYREVKLLDMDNSTRNGTAGGIIVGISRQNTGKIAVVKNGNGSITGIYLVEDNSIDEGYPDRDGYYKLSSPTGSNYTLYILDYDFSTVFKIENITVRQGIYDFDLVYDNETLYIQNTGNFYDTFTLNSSSNHVKLVPSTVSLNPEEFCSIDIINNLTEPENVLIKAVSTGDIGVCRSLSIMLVPAGADLSIGWIKVLNDSVKNVESCISGEILTIKAMVKNTGMDEAKGVTVAFYYDIEDEKHMIGRREYSFIGRYVKYPSVKFDTHTIGEGEHTIIVCVNSTCNESNNNNNRKTIHLTVKRDSLKDEHLLITEVYYFTNPHMENEYMVIFNPSKHEVKLSDFYITDQPSKRCDTQNKILFPDGFIIPSNTSITIAFNATAYHRETGKLPDFEYGVNSLDTIPDLSGCIRLNNNGDVIAVKSRYNSTIDMVVYGDAEYSGEGWKGKSIHGVNRGEILRRRALKGILPDTDSAEDWQQSRIYRIGQSDFKIERFNVQAEVYAIVSPDCSLPVLSRELELADREVLVNVYEFDNEYLAEVLESLLRRGVRIKMLVEGNPVGGMNKKEISILNRLSSRGAEIYLMNGENSLRYGFNHAKYAIVDSDTLVIGSANWDNEGFPLNSCCGNREWVVVVKNSAVAGYFREVFEEDCNVDMPDVAPFREIPVDLDTLDGGLSSAGYSSTFSPANVKANMSIVPVLSPDTSRDIITELIDSAEHTLYIEQMYIHADWESGMEDIIRHLVNASERGVDIKIILNHNPEYNNREIEYVSDFLKAHGMEIRFLSSWFVNLHVKGMVVDNATVLISSINWNEQSVDRNREAGVVIENREVAGYYAEVFLHDWSLCEKSSMENKEDYKNYACIFTIFTAVFALILRDWRKG